jgi:hypothetical protein
MGQQEVSRWNENLAAALMVASPKVERNRTIDRIGASV